MLVVSAAFVTAVLLAPLGAAVNVKYPSGWGDPVKVDSAPASAVIPRVAVDPAGNALAVWQQYDGARVSAFAARFTPSGGWEAPELVEFNQTGDVSTPDVGLGADGNGTAVWAQSTGTRWAVFANSYVPGAGWGTPYQLDPNASGSADLTRVAVAASGRAAAVWVLDGGANESVWGALYDPIAGWTPASRISALRPDVVGQFGLPAVAIDSAGRGLAAWDEQNGTGWTVWASHGAQSGTWEPPVLLESNTSGDANYPAVTVNAAGDAAVAWEQRDALRWNILSNRYIATGDAWQGAQFVENVSVGDSGTVHVSMNADGAAIAVWQTWDGSLDDLYAAQYKVGTGWGAATVLDENQVFDSYWGHVELNDSGAAIVGWTQDEANGHSIDAARFVPGRGWQRPVRISIIDTQAIGAADLGLDASGNAVAVWDEAVAGRWEVSANRFVVPLDETAPVVTLSDPTEGAVFTTASVHVQGVAEPGTTLVVNGLVVDVGPNGAFELQLALAPGANRILASAYDDWGNVGTAAVNVSFADPAPGLAAQLAALQAQLDNTSADLNATRDALEQTSGDLNATALLLLSSTDQLNQTAASLNATRFQFSATVGQMDAIVQELNDTRYELAQARSESAGVEGRLDQTNAQLAALQAAQNGYRVEIDSTKNDLVSARGNLSVAATRLDQNTAELSSTRASLNGATASVSMLTWVMLVGFALMGAGLIAMMGLMSRYLARKPSATNVAAPERKRLTPRPAPKRLEEAAGGAEEPKSRDDARKGS